MFINFEMLLRSELTPFELAMLCAVRQREKSVIENMDRETFEKLEGKGYIEKNLAGRVSITKLGNAAIEAIETPGITEESEMVLKKAIELYESNGKNIGVSRKEAQERMIWFIANTNFKSGVILEAIKDYIAGSGEYTKSLCNLIWNPPSVFAAHKNLKDSKLFDLISSKFSFNTELFFSVKRKREDEWLMAVSKLPIPPANPDMLFTMDKNKEKERLKDLKMLLFNKMRRLK